MQKAWIHPEFSDLDGAKLGLRVVPTPPPEVVKVVERRSLPLFAFTVARHVAGRDTLFGSAVCLSALATLSLFLITSGSRVSSLENEVYSDTRSVIHSSPIAHPIGRTSFLAKIFSSQEREVSGKMRFLSGVIESRLQSHPNPHQLALQIITESLHADYDPVFIAAVINAESVFKHQAVSGRGARGLMQLMPETAHFISRIGNFDWRGANQLDEPTYNLKLGIAYLKYLENKFNGNRERALIAYNWGPANLEVALRNGQRVPMSPITYARGIISTHKKWTKDLGVQVAQAEIGNTVSKFS